SIDRIWAVAAVRGDASKLIAVHQQIADAFQPRDGVVYLGDIIGFGDQVIATIDEILRFRRAVMAVPPLRFTDDFVILRGRQEEMWRKLLQLQFAPNPGEVIDWMSDRGIDPTLRAYGGSWDHLRQAAREGPVALARWSQNIKRQIAGQPGHSAFHASLRRAAHNRDHSLLFVNCGLDPDRPVTSQSDSFWWDARGFERITAPFGGFRKVIRGSDPEGGGWHEGPATLTVDGGCGLGGALHAVCLTATGEIAHVVSA
ncbi:MAG: hypothetical protein ACPGVX_04705, partial [Thalassobaculaceae bacterium]